MPDIPFDDPAWRQVLQRTEQKKGSCTSCWGYCLWHDGLSPMGPLDAQDGMPTIPCPECGANANPQKEVANV